MISQLKRKQTRINLVKGKMELPKKALKKLSNINLESNEIFTTDVYLSDDYMIVPLGFDVFSLFKSISVANEEHKKYEKEYNRDIKKYRERILDMKETMSSLEEETEEIEKEARQYERENSSCNQIDEDKEETSYDARILKTFKKGEEVTASEIENGGYFLFDDEIFVKVKQGAMTLALRVYDFVPLKQIFTSKYSVKYRFDEIIVTELIPETNIEAVHND